MVDVLLRTSDILKPPCTLSQSPLIVLFFNDKATTEIYTLSLHDALPISTSCRQSRGPACRLQGSARASCGGARIPTRLDRKSTRLNSSHRCISYAVFCLKKKKTKQVADLHAIKLPQSRLHRYTTPDSDVH